MDEKYLASLAKILKHRSRRDPRYKTAKIIGPVRVYHGVPVSRVSSVRAKGLIAGKELAPGGGWDERSQAIYVTTTLETVREAVDDVAIQRYREGKKPEMYAIFSFIVPSRKSLIWDPEYAEDDRQYTDPKYFYLRAKHIPPDKLQFVEHHDPTSAITASRIRAGEHL